MPHIVLESCIRCKYTDCVDVCPECPVEAIKAEEDVPEDLHHLIELNAVKSQSWPSITRTKPSLPDAEQWKDEKDKLKYLEG
jgi:ferredoxin